MRCQWQGCKEWWWKQDKKSGLVLCRHHYYQLRQQEKEQNPVGYCWKCSRLLGRTTFRVIRGLRACPLCWSNIEPTPTDLKIRAEILARSFLPEKELGDEIPDYAAAAVMVGEETLYFVYLPATRDGSEGWERCEKKFFDDSPPENKIKVKGG